MEPPSRAQTGNASADNHDGMLFGSTCSGKCLAIAQEMPGRSGLVDEGAFDPPVGLDRQSNQRSASGTQKFPSPDLQYAVVNDSHPSSRFRTSARALAYSADLRE